MALYRQIAGNGTPTDQVGLTISQLFDATRDAINPMAMQPVDYSTSIKTVQPSQPTANPDSGGSTPFHDPRYFDATTKTTPLLESGQGNPVKPVTSVPLPADTKSSIENNILPLMALAAVIVVAIKGDDLLHEKRKIALLGGLGLLYYGMAKNKTV